MQSKNISIVIEALEEHINQVIALNNSNLSQIQEIEGWIEQRERTLEICVAGFKDFLDDYERNHSSNKEWRKTLRIAEEYLKYYKKKEG